MATELSLTVEGPVGFQRTALVFMGVLCLFSYFEIYTQSLACAYILRIPLDLFLIYVESQHSDGGASDILIDKPPPTLQYTRAELSGQPPTYIAKHPLPSGVNVLCVQCAVCSDLNGF